MNVTELQKVWWAMQDGTHQASEGREQLLAASITVLVRQGDNFTFKTFQVPSPEIEQSEGLRQDSDTRKQHIRKNKE